MFNMYLSIMSKGSKGHDMLVKKMTPYSADFKDWESSREPIGVCLNRTRNHCLCGHRANHLLSYQYCSKKIHKDDCKGSHAYILLGASCLREHFTFNAKVKNAINMLKQRPARYCTVCEKRMKAGAHMLDNVHYICHLKTVLIPKAERTLEELIKKEKTTEGLDSIDMRGYIDYLRLTILPGLRSLAEPPKNIGTWKYDRIASINKEIGKSSKKGLNNQDLDSIDKLLDIIKNGDIKLQKRLSEERKVRALESAKKKEDIARRKKKDAATRKQQAKDTLKAALDFTLKYGKFAGSSLFDMTKTVRKRAHLKWLYKNTKSDYLKQHLGPVLTVLKKCYK